MKAKVLSLGLVCLIFVGCSSLPTWLSKDAARKQERENYFKTHRVSSEVREAILNGDVLLGMTVQQVFVSRGKPYDINRSTGSYGVHEQWVMVVWWPGTYGYSGLNKKAKTYAYIYFENGVVTSWQSQ